MSVLVLLQPLRHPDSPAAALRACAVLTRALTKGLAAGKGRVVYLYEAHHTDAEAEVHSLGTAYRALARALQDEFAQHGVTVNGLCLPHGSGGVVDIDDLKHAMAFVTDPKGARIGGAVLPLLHRSD